MSRPDAWAAAGVVLTLIFGIPSIPIFAQGNAALGAAAVVLAVVVLGLTVYNYTTVTRPPFTILSNLMDVQLNDDAGKLATVLKKKTIRPNHRGLNTYIHRNLSCDGSISGPTVDPDVIVIAHEKAAGDYFTTIRFPHQLARFESVETWIRFDLTDAFLNQNETAGLQVDEPTRSISICLHFNGQRQPDATSLKAIYRSGGRDVELPKPQISNGHINWTFARRWGRLPPGEYEVMWRW